MSDSAPVTLAPGERLGKDGKPYNYEEWKQKKIEKGEWLSKEEWRAKKEAIEQPKVMTAQEKFDQFQKWMDAGDAPTAPPLKKKPPSRKRKAPTAAEKLKKREDKILKLTKDTNQNPYESLIKRVIVFDTETTGLSNKDEIVEISLIETVEGIKTGRHLHFFINPEAKITKKAVEIHKLTKEKLKKHPRFTEVAPKIFAFIGSASLLAHNAAFDMGMLNRGFVKGGLPPLPAERFIDSCLMARFLFPEAKNSQDALCERFEIDNFTRVTTGIHSAIEDTAQLYHIYRNLSMLLKEKNIDYSHFRLG